MEPQYVELERDLTLLLWLGISVNDNLSQRVYTAECQSILSECTVKFLTVTCCLWMSSGSMEKETKAQKC
jgi:hypothetical protein